MGILDMDEEAEEGGEAASKGQRRRSLNNFQNNRLFFFPFFALPVGPRQHMELSFSRSCFEQNRSDEKLGQSK
jgi:hypothetical protein